MLTSRSNARWYEHVDVRTVEAFEASAEVLMNKGPMPADRPDAIDARKVMTDLGPTIQLPQPR